MATITWTGAAATVAAVRPFTVVTGSDVSVLKLTAGNGKVVTITTAAPDNATTIAAALAAAWEASTEPEHTEITATSSGAVVTLTGPADGRPFTATPSVTSGTATLTAGSATTGTSPNHLSAARNYSSNSVPANGDTVIWDVGSTPVKWDLDDWTTRTVSVTFVRRSTYTGTIGLPDANPAGYVEFRPKFLETAGTAPQFQQANGDAARAFRVKSTAGSAVTLIAVGSGATKAVGSEPLEIFGLPASSVLDVTGCALAVAPTQGQTAAVLTLLASANSVVRFGSGVTFGSGSFVGTAAILYCGYTGIELDEAANVTVVGAGAGTTTKAYGGTVKWMSTGSPGTVTLGDTGVFDASLAPAAFAVTEFFADKGSRIIDTAERVTKPYDLTTRNCGYEDVVAKLGTHLKFTVNNAS